MPQSITRRGIVGIFAAGAGLAVAAASGDVGYAQPPDRVPRVGALISLAENDPEARTWVASFNRRLQELGWIAGRNIRVDYRWAAGIGEETRVMAAELVAAAPDVILADGIPAITALRRVSSTIPIIFVQVPDPVAIGLVPSLAHPGGNITGFTHFEYSIPGKWLEALKEIAPRVERVLVLRRDAAPGPGALAYATIEAAGRSLNVQVTMAIVLAAADIERAIDAVSQERNVGLISLPNIVTSIHRELIIALAARHRMPAAYPYRHFATAGGLLSYGIDSVYQFRQAAEYVDRVLRGAKPADLPVQQPTKFQLVINLKTAKALGLEVPPMLLARADEVIE